MNIIFDLDETLISTSLRQYKIVSELIRDNKCPSFASYEKERKSQSLTNFQWLKKYQKIDQKFYLDYYLNKIETKEYLQYDTLKVDIKLLDALKLSNHKLFLISMRQNKYESIQQMKYLGLETYFQQIHFINHRLNEENPKFEVVQTIRNNHSISYFIGDNKLDEKAAISNGIIFLPVESSIHNCFDKRKKDINYWLKKITSNGKIL
jgi:phosphoglycolate phosphatase-like HAD superfamily hydrolase